MSIDLCTAARIAQEAGRQEVLTAMEAHGRFNPGWEVDEVGIHYAIRDGLLTHFRTLPEPAPRVAGEYDAITNVEFPPAHKPHRVDLAILHPLIEADAPNTYSGYAWAAKNAAALGLIEVKQNWERAGVVIDATWLDRVSALPPKPCMRKLEWVLLVVFLARATQEAVHQLADTTERAIAEWGFQALTRSNAQEARSHPGSAGVAERWFDVMCYGKACSGSE